MKTKKYSNFILWLTFFFSLSSLAGELKGVKMPDQKEVGGHSLVLNGMGVRRATIFRIDV